MPKKKPLLRKFESANQARAHLKMATNELLRSANNVPINVVRVENMAIKHNIPVQELVSHLNSRGIRIQGQ